MEDYVEAPELTDDDNQHWNNNVYLKYLTDHEWRRALNPFIRSELFGLLCKKLDNEYLAKQTIAPPRQHIFRALQCCPLSKIKACLVGQDPYHTMTIADGFSFR